LVSSFFWLARLEFFIVWPAPFQECFVFLDSLLLFALGRYVRCPAMPSSGFAFFVCFCAYSVYSPQQKGPALFSFVTLPLLPTNDLGQLDPIPLPKLLLHGFSGRRAVFCCGRDAE